MLCVSVLSLYWLLCLLTAGGDKQGTGAVSHIGGVLTLTRPPASSYNPWRVHQWQSNISEAATDYCLSDVYHLTFICPHVSPGSLSTIHWYEVSGHWSPCFGAVLWDHDITVAGDSHHFLRSCLLRATQATVGAGWRMCSLCAAASSRHL